MGKMGRLEEFFFFPFSFQILFQVRVNSARREGSLVRKKGEGRTTKTQSLMKKK